MMPGGLLDAGFGRFFVGVTVSNGSSQPWPVTEVRISPRGRQILSAAAVAVSDGWSLGDAAAVGQPATASEWIPLPVLAAGATYTAYFKLDVHQAAVGRHLFEVELRDPAVPTTTLKARAPIFISRTTLQGSARSFSTECDLGTLTASLSSVTMDQEQFRRVLARVRAVAGIPAPGIRTPAETERLRLRLKDLLCGEESDVCAVLADLTTSCALPTGSPPGPPPATGAGALAIFSTQATTLADRTKIGDGSVGSNGPVTIGNDGIINASVTAGGDVQVGDRTRVQGDVTAGGVIRRTATGGSVIAGVAKEHAPYTPMTIPTKTIAPGSTNVTVANDATQTINPGAYAIVTLRARSKVTFSTGLYQMTQLIIEPDVTLTLSQPTGPVDVRARDALSFGDRLILKAGATTAPGVLAQFYSNQTSEVRVGTDIALFPTVLTVPQGTIHVFSRTNLVGSLFGKTVIVEPDTGVVRVPSDDWLGTGASGLEILAYPTGVSFAVSYTDAFLGTAGPQAFGAVPWKTLLALAMLQLDLALPGAVGAELVSMAGKAVIGNVKASVLNAPTTPPGTSPPPTQAGSVDAAVANVAATRALGVPLFSYLDAAPGEANLAPVVALGQTITTPGTYLTNTEISAILAASGSDPDGLKVYKSGAGTGVTRGLISALVPVSARDDATGTLHFINQLVIVADPAAPAAAGKVAGSGDSGALWIQTRSNKIVGLTHTVGSSGAIASRIEDVVNTLAVSFA